MISTQLRYFQPGLITYSIVTSLVILTPFHSLGGDFALYLAQAKALVDGNSFRLYDINTYCMDHSDVLLGPDIYPPGYPMILSLGYMLVGMDIKLLKLAGIFFFLLFLIVMEKYLKLFDLSPEIQFLSLSLCALNPLLIIGSHHIISDIPFLFFNTCFIFLLRNSPSLIFTLYRSLFVGIILGFTYLIRTVGIVSLLTLIAYYIYYFLSSKKAYYLTIVKNLVFTLLPPFLIGLVYIQTYPIAEDGYISYLALIDLEQIIENLIYYALLPLELPLIASSILYIVLLPILLLGIYCHHKTARLEFIFCILYTGTLILFPFTDGVRLLFPLFPFFIIFFSHGLNKLENYRTTLLKSMRVRKLITPLLITSVFIVHSIFLFRNIFKTHEYVFGNHSSLELFEYVTQHTDPDALIIFSKPRVMYLFTGRTSLALTHLGNIRESQAKLAVFFRFEDQPTTFQPVFQNEEYIIYHLPY